MRKWIKKLILEILGEIKEEKEAEMFVQYDVNDYEKLGSCKEFEHYYRYRGAVHPREFGRLVLGKLKIRFIAKEK